MPFRANHCSVSAEFFSLSGFKKTPSGFKKTPGTTKKQSSAFLIDFAVLVFCGQQSLRAICTNKKTPEARFYSASGVGFYVLSSLLLGITRFYLVSLGFIWSYLILFGVSRFYLVFCSVLADGNSPGLCSCVLQTVSFCLYAVFFPFLLPIFVHIVSSCGSSRFSGMVWRICLGSFATTRA